MLKLGRRARGHFMTLIEIRVHLIRVKPGHICPNAAPQVRINSCIYPKIKITLTFTLTLLLEIGSKGLDLKGHFVLDVKIHVHLIRVKPGHKCIWGTLCDINCLYSEKRVMLKLGRRARGHFMTLIEIRVHLIRVKPGHI